MELLHLSYRNSTIGYYRFGTGPEPAVCFHGYGEDGSSFGFLEKFAGDRFSFFSIDLPFHGKTAWNDGLSFTTADLSRIIEEIMAQNNSRPGASGSQLTVLGFSLGGRAALCLCQARPEWVDKLVLLAPDGLKMNFWYRLSTQTWPGNKLFQLTMKHPGWFFGFLRILNRLKLVQAGIFKFVNFYIGNAELRRLLYARWTTLRKLRPDTRRIRSVVRKNNIQVRLLYGKYDPVILSSTGEKFRKGIEELCTVSVISSGHQLLHEKHIGELLPALLH